MSRGRVLILQHERESIGSVPDWARERGFEIEILHADEDWATPSMGGVEFLVSMGSAAHSYDERVPWLARELEVLAAAEATATPVLGICFGSQSLAIARGGSTRPATEHEIGWLEVETPAPGLIEAGPWMFWHEDSFAVPPGAELLAWTPVGPAAYRSGRDLAIQFHPEATPAAVDGWLASFADELDPAAAARLRRGMAVEPEAAVARAYRLYDTFLDLAGSSAGSRSTNQEA